MHLYSSQILLRTTMKQPQALVSMHRLLVCQTPIVLTSSKLIFIFMLTSGTASLASVNIGAIVGGTVGGILVLLCVFALILGCMIKQHRTKSQSTGRVNYSTARQTATATSTRSVPPQPQQPPAAYTIPQPEAAGSTFTYSYNQPTDPTITAAPPPAYGLHDNFATYKGQNVDAPPYMYNETRSSFSQPPTAPPLYPSQPSFVHPPPYQPQA